MPPKKRKLCKRTQLSNPYKSLTLQSNFTKWEAFVLTYIFVALHLCPIVTLPLIPTDVLDVVLTNMVRTLTDCTHPLVSARHTHPTVSCLNTICTKFWSLSVVFLFLYQNPRANSFFSLMFFI